MTTKAKERIKTVLSHLASRTQQEILKEAGLRSRFSLERHCNISSRYMARTLYSHGFEPIIVEGVLFGDVDMFDTIRRNTQTKEQKEAHGKLEDAVAPNIVHYDPNSHIINQGHVQEIGESKDRYSHVGVEHHWVEVAVNNTVWIVEPYAEMRGENETKPTATSVFPVDYQYVRWSNRNFEEFVTLINEFPGLSIPAKQYPDRIKDLYDGSTAED